MTSLFGESVPPCVRNEERSLWKIVISCHNAKHEEVRRINLPEERFTGNETIGEVVLPTLREELLKMDWNGYGLFAQHEPIYNSTELNDINYQRTIDGTVVLDCEDHNCQWRSIRVPMIQDAECMICLGEIPNESRVYPKCFHSCVCKTCYPTIERCPKCQKRWKFQPPRIAFRESIRVIRRGLFFKQSVTKSGKIFKVTDRLRKKANLVEDSASIPSLSSSTNFQNNQKPLHRSFSTKSVTDEPVQFPTTTIEKPPQTPLNAPSQAIRVYNKTVTKTGSFAHNWPTVHEPIIHYKRAYRATQNLVHADMKNKNERNRQRKYTAQFIDTLMKQLSVPITHLLDLYTKELKNLHPYEQTVANLTMIARGKKGLPELSDVLQRLKQLRAMTSKTAKEFASQASNASSAAVCSEILANATEALQQLYEQPTPHTQALFDLLEIHKDLRRIPIIQLTLPTIVLVGSPNVGKSSIVRAISSGTPEVNDYPFTTRGVTIGHILHQHPETKESTSFQVMDTPGLLDRPEEERNEMERLTFASLLHLPTAVIYVIDHTSQAGVKSTLPAQLNVRKMLKQRFPRRPWIDVISKGDLIPFSPSAQKLFEEYDLRPSENIEDMLKDPSHVPLILSVKDGKNIDIFKDWVIHTLYQLKDMLLKTNINNTNTSNNK